MPQNQPTFVALETRGKHPNIGLLFKALKGTAKKITGVEETTNHLLLCFSDTKERTSFLTNKTLEISGITYPVKAWPFPDSIKVRLKKVGLLTPAENIVRELKKVIPIKKVLLETFSEAPSWRNGHAHFFTTKENAGKLPKAITIDGKSITVKICEKKGLDLNAHQDPKPAPVIVIPPEQKQMKPSSSNSTPQNSTPQQKASSDKSMSMEVDKPFIPHLLIQRRHPRRGMLQWYHLLHLLQRHLQWKLLPL